MSEFHIGTVIRQTLTYGFMCGLPPIIGCILVVIGIQMPELIKSSLDDPGIGSVPVTIRRGLGLSLIVLVLIYLRYSVLRISQKLTGKTQTRLWTIQQTIRQMIPSLITTMLVIAAVALGFAALIVPGLVAISALFLATPICLIEARNFQESIYRSASLTAGYRTKTIVVLLFVAIASAGVMIGIILLFNLTVASNFYLWSSLYKPIVFIFFFAPLFVLPFSLWAAACASAYSQLIIIKESRNALDVASVFD